MPSAGGGSSSCAAPCFNGSISRPTWWSSRSCACRSRSAGMGFGITTEEDIAVTDPTNDVVGHRFHNQFEKDADLEKMRLPRAIHDEAETRRRLAVAHELFDGLLEVRPGGADLNLSLWDPISPWMGVEGALYALVDRPEFMHRLARPHDRGLPRPARPARGAGPALPAPEPDPLHGRLDRRPARPRLRPGAAAHPRHLGHGPGADVLHGLAGDVQGVRGRLRSPDLRALRAGVLRVLRPARPQDERGPA